jgi:hypothetical protein
MPADQWALGRLLLPHAGQSEQQQQLQSRNRRRLTDAVAS